MRVKAVQPGQYGGLYLDIGDVFDLASPVDLSDSTVSQVPVGNPDYPLYGWMLQVSPSTPLYSYAQANGTSYQTQEIYGTDSAGHRILPIPRYVL